MLAQNGGNFFELDRQASTAEQPYAILTSDCSEPKEIDDGFFVEPLPAAQETYRVGVCVADTSRLYADGDVFKKALKNVKAKYWELPNGERGYDPMIDEESIRDLELRSGRERDALIVSFVIGEKQPPTDVDITFGKVDAENNFSYKDFIRRCKDDDPYKKYARVGAFIMHHIRYTAGGDKSRSTEADDAVYNRLLNNKSGSAWLRGSRLNEAYMVAANHLVGKVMVEENRPAIYRVHDPSDETYLEFLPPSVATYSRKPGRHAGLNLDPYCRTTSPLRRLEDFMMCYQLKRRHLGYEPTVKDSADLAAAVQQLNRNITQEISRGPLRLSRHDTLGSRTSRAAQEAGELLATRNNLIEVDIA